MNNADLAEIRALLKASVAPERGRKPLFSPLRGLLPAASPEPSHRKQAYPAPRRVGLRPAEPADVEAVEAILEEPSEAEAERRRAFGQRQEPASEPLPLLRLAAPDAAAPPDDEALVEMKRRRSLRLAAPAPAETPYHPEDLTDDLSTTGGAHTEALYAESGLFEPAAPSPAPDAADATEADRAVLERLEALFLAEAAALARLKAKPRD